MEGRAEVGLSLRRKGCDLYQSSCLFFFEPFRKFAHDTGAHLPRAHKSRAFALCRGVADWGRGALSIQRARKRLCRVGPPFSLSLLFSLRAKTSSPRRAPVATRERTPFRGPTQVSCIRVATWRVGGALYFAKRYAYAEFVPLSLSLLFRCRRKLPRSRYVGRSSQRRGKLLAGSKRSLVVGPVVGARGALYVFKTKGNRSAD